LCNPEFEEPDRPVCTDVAGGECVQFGRIAEADLRRPRKVNRLARTLLEITLDRWWVRHSQPV